MYPVGSQPVSPYCCHSLNSAPGSSLEPMVTVPVVDTDASFLVMVTLKDLLVSSLFSRVTYTLVCFLPMAKETSLVCGYYATGMYPMLDGLCAQYGAPTSLQITMMPTTAAGLKTQTTWEPSTAVTTESGEKVGTAKGFHGDITATVTLNADGTIAAVALDTSSETAGIGSLVGENADFAAQFVGKTGPFTLGAGIDVVAGASVTSEAAVLAVNNALK